MEWTGFREVYMAGDTVGFDLVVDELVVRLADLLHRRAGREVLFYMKMTVPPVYRDGRMRFYVGFKGDPVDEVYIPRQVASAVEVRSLEPDYPPSYSYAVVHTHPPGVDRFSRVDVEGVNVNHTVSLVVTEGRLADAVVSFNLSGYIVEARPRVTVARRRLVLSSLAPGFGLVDLGPLGDGEVERVFKPLIDSAGVRQGSRGAVVVAE